jgi:hypothetical protein
MASIQMPSYNCWICGYEVSLERCKIDEHGRPVHEQCYVAKIQLQAGGKTQQSPGPV